MTESTNGNGKPQPDTYSVLPGEVHSQLWERIAARLINLGLPDHGAEGVLITASEGEALFVTLLALEGFPGGSLRGTGGRPFDGSAIASGILRGEKPDAARIEEVAKRIGENVDPDSDIHAPADYRKHLAGVMTRRALLGASQRTGAEGKAG